MKSEQIILTGSIALDRLMKFDGVFKDHINTDNLDIISLSVFLQDLKDVRGGVAANIAYSLALLGDHPVLLGSAGCDSKAYMNDLQSMGVNTEYLHYSQLATASFNCISDKKGCQIGGFYPGAMFDSKLLTLKHWYNSNPIVVISPHDPKTMLVQIQECSAYKLRLFFDIGQQVTNASKEVIEKGVRAAQLLIVNEHELGILSKKLGITTQKLKQTVPIVITTLGEKGSVIEGNTVSAPLYIGVGKPEQFIDPTGAGDAYRAGFLYGFIRHWELKTCGQMGALLSTYVIEHFGAQGHMFTKEAFINRYKRTFGENLSL